jgi:methylglutaconyl-CoA hydratase
VSDLAETREGPIATLTLDRPERRNALDPTLMRALADRVQALDAEPGVRVIVLTGAGSAFSAGADLEWMRASRDLSSDRNLDDARAMERAFDLIDGCGTAVIARVHGAAIGGGAGLVACVDVAVAAEEATFGFAEARLGLIPAIISPYVIRAIGPGHARAAFTSAALFDAVEAHRIGLVHRVVAAGDLDAAVTDVAASVLAAGPDAVAASKRLVRDATAAFVLPDLAERIALARTSPEGQEGIAAFLERRSPRWAPSNDS